MFRLCTLGGLFSAFLCMPVWAQSESGVSCTASAAPAPVRSTGISEPLPDILLTCVAEGPINASARPDLRLGLSVALNVSVTNTLVSGTSAAIADAVLVVNGNDCAEPSQTGSTYGLCGASATTVQDPQLGRLTDVTTLEWADVAVPFPGALRSGGSGQRNPAESTVRIRGIRANASALRLASGAASAGLPITASLSIHSVVGAALRNASLPLARPLAGIGLGVTAQKSASTCGGDVLGEATVHLREGFAGSFRSVPPQSATGDATRVLLEFADVPAGVGVRVPPFVACHQPAFDGDLAAAPDALELALVSGHDPTGAGGTVSAGGGGPNMSIDTAQGIARAVYAVVSDAPAQLEDCHIPTVFEAETGQAVRARATVSASFAPLSAALVGSADAPSPRFVPSLSAAESEVEFAACRTTLLFPFVTSQAGFDTGLIITHGSLPALGGVGEARGGACDLHFFGVGPEGQAELLVQHTTVIEPGEQLVFTFADGNPARNIIRMDQFQGYLIADCRYPGARGYAFMSDGVGGIADLAMGYLAPVITLDSSGRRIPLGYDGP